MGKFYKNRASICHFDLKFTFLAEEQAEYFIKEYLKWNIPVKFTYEENTDTGVSKFIITINDMCWAENLKDIAKILIECDKMDEEK